MGAHARSECGRRQGCDRPAFLPPGVYSHPIDAMLRQPKREGHRDGEAKGANRSLPSGPVSVGIGEVARQIPNGRAAATWELEANELSIPRFRGRAKSTTVERTLWSTLIGAHDRRVIPHLDFFTATKQETHCPRPDSPSGIPLFTETFHRAPTAAPPRGNVVMLTRGTRMPTADEASLNLRMPSVCMIETPG